MATTSSDTKKLLPLWKIHFYYPCPDLEKACFRVLMYLKELDLDEMSDGPRVHHPRDGKDFAIIRCPRAIARVVAEHPTVRQLDGTTENAIQ